MKDFYNILGLNRKANTIQIKKAYRSLSIKLHPDINKASDAHERFVEIIEAYQVLGHQHKRNNYDRLYDYQILNQEPKRQKRYSKRNSN